MNSRDIRFALVLTVGFVILDWVIHTLGILPSVLPDYYYIGKFITLPLAYLGVNHFFPRLKGFWYYTLLGTMLQVRYIIFYNYTLAQNIMFILVHTFLIFITFKLIKLVLKED